MTENKCDLISREALKEAFEDCTGECACCVHNTNDFEYCGLIDNVPTVYPICEDKACKYRANERLKGEWIPIKMRPGTDEEYEEFSKYGDCPREDFCVFDCQLPDDDQEVLITTLWGIVCIDTWHREIDCSWFEDHEDIDDVIAWMPLPEGYKKEVRHEDS